MDRVIVMGLWFDVESRYKATTRAKNHKHRNVVV